ncbi:hypothetical protein DSECCO2_643710 [anaerobic digester metagenome]
MRNISYGLCAFALLAGIGGGMLIQAKVQITKLPSPEAAAALWRVTAERDRLLEHLADVESSGRIGADCTPLMVWACPQKGGAQ